VTKPEHVGLRHDREQDRVVVPVIRALHLHEKVAACRGAGDADRVHRRLGARVHEAHLLELEPLADRLGQRDGGLRGDGEVDALVGDLADRLDDLRVRVPDDVHAEPAVEVDVLGPVDVPHSRPLPLAEVDGIGVAGLEVGGHAVRHAPHGALEQALRQRRPFEESGALSFGDLVRPGLQSFDVHSTTSDRRTVLVV
jgi:hypothetical protein